ncbi:HDIG domain-containing metalloprotein [Desulfurivibrio sp. C05AmB]|jgi:uncharacterized protein|uniref:HDIG domain-containing metalloprotein n=1 Tax=Desulfurivibrio sp. C05AmB TaxID=3374371 RepID=UPI00376F15A0
MIPSEAECLRLMAHYRMPDHIREHSLLVARVSGLLTRLLVERGRDLRVDLAVAGGLLHDIAKAMCLDGGCRHAELGRVICREHGFTELEPLVAEHVVLRQGFNGHCGERELVFYADKRVQHSQLVSLAERRDDIIQRYAANDPPRQELIRQNFLLCQRLEAHIFAELPLAADDLGAWLANEDYSLSALNVMSSDSLGGPAATRAANLGSSES